MRIGTAGWNIPRNYAGLFPPQGSHLQRYASRFDAVEINSSFHRPHRRQTYERWAASVPADFQFSVKLPKTITHEHRLKGCEANLSRFQGEVEGLGHKLGVLLVQLPPSLMFGDESETFLLQLRDRFQCAIACEPRNPSWFAASVDVFLEGHCQSDVAPSV